MAVLTASARDAGSEADPGHASLRPLLDAGPVPKSHRCSRRHDLDRFFTPLTVGVDRLRGGSQLVVVGGLITIVHPILKQRDRQGQARGFGSLLATEASGWQHGKGIEPWTEKLTAEEQRQRFIEAAREAGVSEDEAASDANLKRIARAKAPGSAT